jgi:peptidoglycan hydrolase-like protein with peptidoglycan-binding domain
MQLKVNPIALLSPDKRPRLRRGAKGSAVEHLQGLLNPALGLYIPMKAYLGQDGDFGPNTEDAVSLFQYRKGLTITGVVDAAT